MCLGWWLAFMQQHYYTEMRYQFKHKKYTFTINHRQHSNSMRCSGFSSMLPFLPCFSWSRSILKNYTWEAYEHLMWPNTSQLEFDGVLQNSSKVFTLCYGVKGASMALRMKVAEVSLKTQSFLVRIFQSTRNSSGGNWTLPFIPLRLLNEALKWSRWLFLDSG